MHFRNITRKLNPRQKDEAKFSFILHGTVNSFSPFKIRWKRI